MKCPACQAEFTPPPGRSLSNCPICDEPFVKPVVAQKCETLADALELIAATHGRDTLLNGQRLVAFLHDYLPRGKGERNILKNAFSLEIPQKLESAAAKPQAEQTAVMARCVGMLVDDFMMAQSAAEEYLWIYATALGWQGRPAPQPEAPKPPPPEPKAEAKAVTGTSPGQALESPLANEKGFFFNAYTVPSEVHNTTQYSAYIIACSMRIETIEQVEIFKKKVEQYSKNMLTSEGSFKAKTVIIAHEIEGDALEYLGDLPVDSDIIGLETYCVSPAEREAFMQDLCVYTEGKIVTGDLSPENITGDYLGWAAELKLHPDYAIILEGEGSKEAIADHMNSLLREIERPGQSGQDRKALQARYDMLVHAMKAKTYSSLTSAISGRKNRRPLGGFFS